MSTSHPAGLFKTASRTHSQANPHAATQTPAAAPSLSENNLASTYKEIRHQSEELCAALAVDDYGLQAMAETSPPKWHLAHTTWFFETFVLKPFVSDYRTYHPQFEVLFNSYYNGVGEPFPRPQRGLLSRPTVREVEHYRHTVDAAMQALLTRYHPQKTHIDTRVRLGLNHEQQHQELLLTDIKYSFFQNPLLPAYCDSPLLNDKGTMPPLTFCPQAGGTLLLGATTKDTTDNSSGFHFDNETPQHPCILQPFVLANRLVTNGEYLNFIHDKGYHRHELWLADGWNHCQQARWEAPLYWCLRDKAWFEFTLHGLQPLDHNRPVCHVSFYEADAYARWAGCRLPTEAEWESVAATQTVQGNLLNHAERKPQFHPRAAPTTASGAAIDAPVEAKDKRPQQLYGDTWEWTSSSYAPYPGYRPAEGALGEYNGKFMCNQMVLRGGSCVTPADHIRATYRNFFYPADRWQFSGIRLAQ